MHASVTVRVCIQCGRKTGMPGEGTIAGLLGIKTEPKQTYSHLPKAPETNSQLSLSKVETLV